MSEFVSNIALEVNGQEITDWKTVKEGGRVLRKQINLARKTGHINVTPRHTVTVDYAIPSDAPEIDFAGVVGGTLTIDYLNGKRLQFGGVCCLEIGETTFDGDNEAVRPITFGAESRTEA